MDERGALRARVERLGREVAKFGAVGAVGVLVNIGVSNLIWRTTDIPVVRAGLMATCVAILFNYVGFRYWTYRDRDKSGRTRELMLFLAFSAVGAVIEVGVLYAATYWFGWDTPLQNNIFKIVGIGIATLFRFWSYRTWVFRALPAKETVLNAESFLKRDRAEAVPPAGPVPLVQQVTRTEPDPAHQ